MNKKAIVMGASSGIGRELAERLLRDGWQVGVAARRMEKLEELSVSNPDRLAIACIDITREDAALKLRQLIEHMGGVNLYIHASGFGKQNSVLAADIEQRTVDTNVGGFTQTVGEVFRWMAAHDGGQIAVITSIAGIRGLAPAPSYSATKSYQIAYIQALEQLSNNRRLNVRFTDLRPGFVDTDFIRGSRFPMMLDKSMVADEIMWAIDSKRHVRIIDWKWRLIVAAWHLLPNFLWRRMRLVRS
ncbi:MAG: SDR family NAD(P)-dependent oxidoreductase [Prevotella sp.]|nr:SDR family NAD(P)-dependent oxidoreductase [Prevotella sp.]